MVNEQLEILGEINAANAAIRVSDGMAVVELDPDHPGFRDKAYRKRRDTIAQIAMDYRSGNPIPDAPYTAYEHSVWRTVRESLTSVHQQLACKEYLEALEKMQLPWDEIPQLQRVNEKVERLSGFRLEPAGGLIQPKVFLSKLGQGVFFSTQYIRHHSTPLYTPEPDVVHDVVGHGPVLAQPRLARLHRLIGQAAARTNSDEGVSKLAHIYWYTIEFGVLKEQGRLKAYGAGLLSSAGELEAIHNAELRPFDIAEMSCRAFDVTQFQPVLYCADSFDEMAEQLESFLTSWADPAH